MVPVCKSKSPSYFFFLGIGQKLTTGTWKCHFQAIPCVIEKFRLIVFALYIKVITRISLGFSELSLWPDTQSFDKWSIPTRLEVLHFTQNYQTEQNDFDSKMPDRHLHLYSDQITSLQLSQVTLQPQFNLNNVTCIYTSICSIMFYCSRGDLRYEWTTFITWFVNRETSQICSNSHSTPTQYSILKK